MKCYAFNQRAQLESILAFKPNDGAANDIIMDVNFMLDDTGNRIAMGVYNPQTQGYEAVTYAFDPAYRLTGETRIVAFGRTVHADAFTYDAVGNRLTREVSEGGAAPLRTVYAYNNANQLVRSVTTGGGDDSEIATDYSYDADGNLIRQARSGGEKDQVISIEYDALGRQRRWSDGVNEERTVYRGAEWHRWGTRTTGTNPGAGYAPTTHYLYDGSDVVADFASTGRGNFTLMKSYVSAGLDANLSVTHHAPVGDFLTPPIDPSGTGAGQGAGAGRGVGAGAQPMGSGLGGGRGGRGARGGLPTNFYHADGLGSIRTLTNEQGIVTNTRDYTAFGEARQSYVHPALGTAQRYTYTGREDSPLATSGAPMYYRYRMYDPSIGRFTRRDPAGYPNNISGNLYKYANNSPMLFKDPFGLIPVVHDFDVNLGSSLTLSLGEKITLFNAFIDAAGLASLSITTRTTDYLVGNSMYFIDERNEFQSYLISGGGRSKFHEVTREIAAEAIRYINESIVSLSCSKWIKWEFAKVSDIPGHINTALWIWSANSLFDAGWWLNQAHTIEIKGSMRIKCDCDYSAGSECEEYRCNRILIEGFRFDYVWHDEIDANSWWERPGNKPNRLKWFIEGSYDLIFDKALHSDWKISVSGSVNVPDMRLLPAVHGVTCCKK